jgi:hypothetical protein
MLAASHIAAGEGNDLSISFLLFLSFIFFLQYFIKLKKEYMVKKEEWNGIRKSKCPSFEMAGFVYFSSIYCLNRTNHKRQ